jgi:hypothetical protein
MKLYTKILVGAVATVAIVGVPGDAHALSGATYVPCAYEDSPGPCYWNASVAGNGEGHSFYVDQHQELHYVDSMKEVRGWLEGTPQALRAIKWGHRWTVLLNR